MEKTTDKFSAQETAQADLKIKIIGVGGAGVILCAAFSLVNIGYKQNRCYLKCFDVHNKFTLNFVRCLMLYMYLMKTFSVVIMFVMIFVIISCKTLRFFQARFHGQVILPSVS